MLVPYFVLLSIWIEFTKSDTNVTQDLSPISENVMSQNNVDLIAINQLKEFEKYNLTTIQQLCPPMYYYCDELPAYCLNCNFNYSCTYGETINVTCSLLDHVYCRSPFSDIDSNDSDNSNGIVSDNIYHDDNLGMNGSMVSHSLSNKTWLLKRHTDYVVTRQMICRYCHQSDDSEIICIGRINCHYPNLARSFYESKCEPFPHILCLGNRVFRRMLACDWSSGKKYSVAVLLSVFFGGLGVDRFYLGMWVEGIGKLLSFGGFGVWSVVDFFLIATGYVKPAGDAVYW